MYKPPRIQLWKQGNNVLYPKLTFGFSKSSAQSTTVSDQRLLMPAQQLTPDGSSLGTS